VAQPEELKVPISYEIDQARGLVLSTAGGILTDGDILSLKARLLADPRWSPGMRELADVRAIERLEVTTDGVRRMAGHDAAFAPAIGSYRLALVVPRDEVFGMARMYQMLTEPAVPYVGVFRDLAEAAAWLEAG
jgi:hypothetical protein